MDTTDVKVANVATTPKEVEVPTSPDKTRKEMDENAAHVEAATCGCIIL